MQAQLRPLLHHSIQKKPAPTPAPTPALTPAPSTQPLGEHTAEHAQQKTQEAKRRVLTEYSNSVMWREEHEACCNAVTQSPHTSLVVMPNHSLNLDGELTGYMFSAHPEDSAEVLPVGKRMCAGVSMYECKSISCSRQPYNTQVLHVMNNLQRYRNALLEYVKALHASVNAPASFECIPGRDDIQDSEPGAAMHINMGAVREQHVWREEIPCKVGLYHAYTSCSSSPFREHKLFIVVSGCQTHAAEELHNLWQDTKHNISCLEFAESEELHWLRSATQRLHNRIASDIASIFDLNVPRTLDMDDPTGQRHMLFPTTSTIHNDIVICQQTGRIKVTDHACLPASSSNGILFEMYGAEGFWLFHGPRDHSNCNPYGGEFACTGPDSAFPTKTSQFNERFKPSTPADVVKVPRIENASMLFGTAHVTESLLQQTDLQQTDESDLSDQSDMQHAPEGNMFLYPSENFMRTLQRLGFNRNDGITYLMPLVCHISDE